MIAPADFEYLRSFLRENAAIVLDDGKEYLAETRLTPLLHHEGFASIEDLFGSSLRKQHGELGRKVLNAMTNNETRFFRDFLPFKALRREILPALIQARSASRTLRLWSAASATGQEPYSLALLLREHFPLPGWTVEIMATDISTAALDRAQEGKYSQMEVSRGLPAALLTRYFHRCGLDWELDASVRSAVQFRHFNLAQPWPDMPRMDIVVLRNVMIYFDLDIRKQILARVRSVLAPDGTLFLGCAETTRNLDAAFERIPFEKTAYYRVNI